MIRRARKSSEREPTIALINIVFLMLIFFLVAGTLAKPLDPSLKLVRTGDLEGTPPPDALVILPDGGLRFRGEPVADVAEYLAGLDGAEAKLARLVPDRALPAEKLVAIGRAAREAGAERVVVVTERGLEQ